MERYLAIHCLNVSNWVSSVMITADGHTVLSESWDKTMRVWDVESVTAVREPLRGHEDWVTSVSMFADAQIVESWFVYRNK